MTAPGCEVLPAPKRGTIIANRGSGSFCRQQLEQVQEQLRQGGFEAELCVAADFGEMTSLAAELSQAAEQQVVIAAGGDGTINAVLNGLAGNNAVCALLPFGTANVLAREIGIETSDQAVQRILSDRVRPFSAGLLHSGQRESRFFLMAGIGLDGFVVRGVSHAAKRLLGKGAYLLAAAAQAARWERGELTVTTPDETFTCHSLFVCNCSRYGGSFVLAPGAGIFTPTLELVAVQSSSRRRYISLVAGMAGGTPPAGSGDVLVRQVERVRVEGGKPVQADGDDWGDSPVEIMVEPEYARIMV